MVTPTVDSELMEQFLANTPEPVREHVDLYVDYLPRTSLDPQGGNASAIVTGVPGATSVRAEGELVAARRMDIG